MAISLTPGLCLTNSLGQEFSIVEYIHSSKVKVKFTATGYERVSQAGDIRRGRVRDLKQDFLDGAINEFSVGLTYLNNWGHPFHVVSFTSSSSITIEFLWSGTMRVTTAKDIQIGIIKDRLLPVVYGRGYAGFGKVKSKQYKKARQTWAGMLERVHGGLERYDSYKDVIIDDSWYDFSIFQEWFDKNYKPGMVLDKDLLSEEVKIYSPETCIFIPATLNSFLANISKREGRNLPPGVHLNKRGTFDVYIDGSYKSVHSTISDAAQVVLGYKIEKLRSLKLDEYYFNLALGKIFEAYDIFNGENNMSWNQQNNGYGGGGGYGGGRGKFTPPERPTLPLEHELHPTAEAAIKEKPELKNYARRGAQVSTETTVLNSDPARKSIMVPRVCLMAFSQCGIPHDHPNYPPIKKFDTRFDGNFYYVDFSAGPIAWVHDDNWRHIPGFTRYVMDKFDRVLNAYNGKAIEPINQWGLFELVPDSPSNKLRKVNLSQLRHLAFAPLPEEFRDFGGMNYSHDFGVDAATGKVGWIPKPKVKVKNHGTGNDDVFPNIFEFLKCCLPPKEFNTMREIQDAYRDAQPGRGFEAGNCAFRVATNGDMPELPKIAVDSAPAAEEVKTDAPDASGGGFDFNEDIPF